jgi:tetratricopeptide (TPR) repeat protein
MRGTTNREAFNAYLQGERFFSVISEERMRQSRAMFERATMLDEGFARAWGWRSYTTVRSVMVGWLSDGELPIAGEWAKRAVRLDPEDYATYWDLAFYHLNAGDADQAIPTYRIALDLYDNHTDMLDRKPGLLAEMAEAYVHVGQLDEALTLLKRATRTPDWYRWNLGWAEFHAGNFDNSISAYSGMSLKPGDRDYVMEVQLFLAAAHILKAQEADRAGDAKMRDEARAEAQKALNQFRAAMPGYTLEQARKRRHRFHVRAQEDRWLEALRLLGFA